MANDEATPGDGAVDACSGDTCMAISDPLALLSSVEEESDDTPHALAYWTWVAGNGASSTGPRTSTAACDVSRAEAAVAVGSDTGTFKVAAAGKGIAMGTKEPVTPLGCLAGRPLPVDCAVGKSNKIRSMK